MQTLMLTVEYDGTRYAGWKAAPKKENLDTVLGRIHTALARLLKEDIQLFCAAKTDPGVHARGQILSFQTTSKEQSESGAASGYRRFRCQTGFRTFSCRITPQTLYLGALHQNRSDS